MVSSTTGESACPAYPRTRSLSTAPAPTDVSCSGSPTRISRLSGRSASSSRAIIVSSTMDDSSTTTTSCLSRLPRSCLNLVALSGRQPSSRCRVTPCGWPRRATPSGTPVSPASSAVTASCSRLAALPVGAVSATEIRSPRAAAWSASSASIRATVVVLPVPGPPVRIVVHRRTAVAAASTCWGLACSPRTSADRGRQPRLVDDRCVL